MKHECEQWCWTSLLVIGVFALPVSTLSAKEVAINWLGGVGNSLSQPREFYGGKEALHIADTVLLP